MSLSLESSMPKKDDADTCAVCRRGRLALRNEKISFYQWTDKGYLLCEAEIQVRICLRCGSKNWDDDAEAAIEEAVRRARNKVQ
jgi:hypothetical protein